MEGIVVGDTTRCFCLFENPTTWVGPTVVRGYENAKNVIGGGVGRLLAAVNWS